MNFILDDSNVLYVQASNARNLSNKKTMTLAQRAVFWARKLNNRTWADSDDDEEYTITDVRRNTAASGKPGRLLVAHCKRKKDGAIIHENGERLPYIAAKFGFSITNNGTATGDNTKHGLPTAEDAEQE